MTDNKLFLNIQLFAENGTSETGGNEMQSAEEFGIRNSEFGMNEKAESDVLNNEAGIEDDEVVTEDTEDEAETFEVNEDDEFIREREERLRNRISGWLKEGEGIKEAYPDFDLRNELRSSRLFAQLVLAGAPLKASYEIVHKDEIISGAMAYTADKVREQVVKNIEAKGRRPLENGISSESAVMTAIDVNALTAKDIRKILKQVENGASIKF